MPNNKMEEAQKQLDERKKAIDDNLRLSSKQIFMPNNKEIEEKEFEIRNNALRKLHKNARHSNFYGLAKDILVEALEETNKLYTQALTQHEEEVREEIEKMRRKYYPPEGDFRTDTNEQYNEAIDDVLQTLTNKNND